MAAGLGERLRPLTDETPKCLLPINGRPILEIWLDCLERHGVEEVLVNTHWLHEKVEDFIDQWPDDRLRIVRSFEPRLLGSAGTLLVNRDWIDEKKPFFVIYSDSLCNPDLSRMMAFHQEHGLPFTLGVFWAAEPRSCGIAELDRNGLVIGFEEKPQRPKSDLAAAGIYVADSRIFDYFPAGSERAATVPLDIGFDIIPRLCSRMMAYFIGEVIDIGTPESYRKALARGGELTG